MVYVQVMCWRAHLLVRLVGPVRVEEEEEPRLESRPRWPVGEVTDEEVVVVVEEVVEELRSSCRLPKEPLGDGQSRVTGGRDKM